MYRPRGLFFIAVAVIGFAIILDATVWLAVDPAGMNEGILTPIIAVALIILELLLVFFLWRWLNHTLERMPDLALFLAAILAALLGLIFIISWYRVEPHNLWLVVPIAMAFFIIWTIERIWKRLNPIREEVNGGTIGVVQRNGVFNRFENSGPIWLPRSDHLAHQIPTADQSLQIHTRRLHAANLTYGYVFRLRYRLTPRSIPEPDDNKLQHLYAQPKTRQVIQTTVDGAILRVQTRHGMQAVSPNETDFFEALVRIVPDRAEREEYLTALTAEVAKELAEKGVTLDEDQGIAVEALQLPKALIDEMTPSEFRRLLAEHRTNMGSLSFSQMYAWIAHALPLDTPQDLNGLAEPQPFSDVRSEEGQKDAGASSEPDETSRARAETGSADEGPDDHFLSPSDLSFMKSIPEQNTGTRPTGETDEVGGAMRSDHALSPGDLSIMKEIPA